jgi:hypothetical protein
LFWAQAIEARSRAFEEAGEADVADAHKTMMVLIFDRKRGRHHCQPVIFCNFLSISQS